MLLYLSFLLLWAPLAPIVHGFARSHSSLPASTQYARPTARSQALTSNLRMTPRPHAKSHIESTSMAGENYILSTANRRQAIQKAAAVIATTAISILVDPTTATADIEGVVSVPQSSAPPESNASNVNGKSVTVFKTKSGLQYIDLVEGSGVSPRYGNFVSISYKAYIKLPDIQGKQSKFDEFDSDSAYLIKHGNGRTVPGLDEGLHTMKVGGKRRIIIPPKLGYVTSGLGPIPPGPYGRWKLNRLLDRMIEVKGGNVIFDVEMRSVIEDEADQGYYEDESLSPEDFNTLRQNIERSQQAARGNA